MRIPITLLALLPFVMTPGCQPGSPPDDSRGAVDPDLIDRSGTCQGRCGEQAPTGCYCDDQCLDYDDCCLDRDPVCTGGPAPDSCQGRCGGQAPAGCACDDGCVSAGTCCADHAAECGPAPDPDSCQGRCGSQAPGGCYCDDICTGAGNCCVDYEAECGPDPDPDSCQGRCGSQAPGGCWCDTACGDFGNCCADYAAECAPSGDPWVGLSDDALIAALTSATTSSHAGLDYTTARNHMYGVDGGIGFDIVGGLIEGIYTGVTAAPDGTRTPGGILNTEHSWPQSEGADIFPRRGDIHHLFPTDQTANSQRSSYEFGETVCTGAACQWDQGGSELGASDTGQTVFQVRQLYRGDIARAHFYFSVRYALVIGADEEATLKGWHEQDPPDTRERTRNDAIESVQGNRNPFVDYPDIVDRIGDF